MTTLESFAKSLHNNFFYKEYTFSQTQFSPAGASELELADNIVWLDNLFFIFQIKERTGKEDDTVEDVTKWFDNKIIKKAVSQIKNTLQYLSSQTSLKISNDRQHYFDLTQAPVEHARKIILYIDKSGLLPQELRLKKFHVSKSVGPIHLFHAEDYKWVCNYLITPSEIDDYLSFREAFYIKQPVIDTLPEQYVLGHYLVGAIDDPITPGYIDSLRLLKKDVDEFDLSFFIDIFAKRLLPDQKNGTDYYLIQKEIVKLMRHELREFKLRFLKSMEDIKMDKDSKPYRMYFPRTRCGFVFIPLHSSRTASWYNALVNYTNAQKYDSKADKCIGVVIFKRHDADDEMIEVYWALIEFPWEHDEEWEEILKNYYPFLPAETKKVFRYQFESDL